MHRKLEHHVLHMGCRLKCWQHSFYTRSIPSYFSRSHPMPMKLDHGHSQQFSTLNQFHLVSKFKRINLRDSPLQSHLQNLSKAFVCQYSQAFNGLARRPELVDNISKELQLKGWNSSTIHALESMDSIITPKTVSLVLNGKVPFQPAMGFFKWIKKKQGFKPTVSMYNAMIKMIGKVGKVDEIKSVMKDMTDTGCDMDVTTYINLINAYSIADDTENVINVYNLMKKSECHPNVVLYTDLISALGKGKRFEKLIDVYNEMITSEVYPSPATLCALMKVLYEAGKLGVAFEIFKKLEKMKLRPTPSMYALLIEGHAKAGNLEIVKELIYEMQGYAFSAGPIFLDVVEILSKTGKKKEATLISELLWPNEKQRPKHTKTEENSKSSSTESKKAQNREKLSWSEIARKLQIWTPSTISYLEAASVDWQSHNVVLVIHRVKNAKIASAFYYWLKKSGFRHDKHTAAALVLKLTNSGMLAEALHMMQEVRKEGVGLPLLVCNQVIISAAINKKFEVAQAVLDLIKQRKLKPNLMTYSTLLVHLAQNQQHDAALEIYQNMLRSGISPDNISIASLIYHLGSSGKIEEAKSIFTELLQYGLKFNTSVYLSLIYAYAKNGNADLAVKTYSDMKSAGLERVASDEATARILSSLQNVEASNLKDGEIGILESFVLSYLSRETDFKEQLIDVGNVLVRNLPERRS